MLQMELNDTSPRSKTAVELKMAIIQAWSDTLWQLSTRKKYTCHSLLFLRTYGYIGLWLDP